MMARRKLNLYGKKALSDDILEEIRNQTHIYNGDKCMWEEVWNGYSQPFGG